MSRVRTTLLLSLLATGCAIEGIPVSFPQMLLPKSGFDGLDEIALSLDPRLSEDLQREILEEMQTCPMYQDVRLIDRPIVLEGNKAAEGFEAYLKKNGPIPGNRGILNIQIEHQEENLETELSQSLMSFDQPDHEWVPSYGVPRIGSLGFPDPMELAPDTKTRKRPVTIKRQRMQKVMRISLYNRNLRRVAVDRVSNSQSTLFNFSKRPGLRRARFSRMMDQSVLAEVMFYACPSRKTIERNLYQDPRGTKLANDVNEGVSAAQDEQWNQAATSWTDVLEADTKNIYARHNLGVYLERQGDVPEALNHYRFSRKKLGDVYADILISFLPQEIGLKLYPQVSFLTGGNWLFVSTRLDKMPVSASVYRLTTVNDTVSLKPIGLNLREVGTLRFVAEGRNYRLARIREFLVDSPIRPGDIVIFDDTAEKAEDL